MSLSKAEAIDILRNSKPNKKKKFNYIIEGFGPDLQSEHERYLVERKFKKLLKKMIKQRAESIDVYKKNNRDDLLKIEENEHKILSDYLPKQF